MLPETPPGRLVEFLRGDLAVATRHIARLINDPNVPYRLMIEIQGSLMRCLERIERDVKRSPADQHTHEHLLTIVTTLASDYEPYGQTERDGLDCSCGCIWFAPLEDHPFDWGVCTKRGAPRCGMLTFEHQNGLTCFEGQSDEQTGQQQHSAPTGEG